MAVVAGMVAAMVAEAMVGSAADMAVVEALGISEAAWEVAAASERAAWVVSGTPEAEVDMAAVAVMVAVVAMALGEDMEPAAPEQAVPAPTARVGTEPTADLGRRGLPIQWPPELPPVRQEPPDRT